jgi:hypothetical protein
VNQLMAGTIVALALIASVTVLAWHGTIDGQAAISIISAASAAGGLVVHSATKRPPPGA